MLKTMENLGRVMYEVELPLIPGERGIIFAHECVIVMNDYDTWKSTDPDDAAYCPHGHWHGEGCDECEPPVEPPAKQ